MANISSTSSDGKEKKKLNVKITFNSPVILTFTGVCLLATILGAIFKDGINLLLFSTYRSSLLSPLTYVRAFCHVFGHAGWAHFIGNMSYILLLGPLLEEKYGSGCLVEIIGLTGVCTAVINAIFFPDIAVMGASGVVFAFIILSSITSFKKGEIPITFILVAIIYIGGQIYDGIFVNDNISNMAHIVGGIVGAMSGFLLANPKEEG